MHKQNQILILESPKHSLKGYIYLIFFDIQKNLPLKLIFFYIAISPVDL